MFTSLAQKSEINLALIAWPLLVVGKATKLLLVLVSLRGLSLNVVYNQTSSSRSRQENGLYFICSKQ